LIPEPFKNVGGIWMGKAEDEGFFVVMRRLLADFFCGDDELSTHIEMEPERRWALEERLVDGRKGKFAAVGIFAPILEEAMAQGVIGINDKTQPEKISGNKSLRGKIAEDLMKVSGVVKGMALTENRVVGERVVALNNMVEVSVGFAPVIGQGEKLRRGS
jgi:hypothetical protein